MTRLRIVIDARRIHDFGIGTYSRNLVQALAAEDPHNLYSVVISPRDLHELPTLPENFYIATYGRSDVDFADHIAFPAFLRKLEADLYHIPVNAVPLLMPKPYVVTIHDMASLLYDPKSGLLNQLRLYRFRRGLARADRVIRRIDRAPQDIAQIREELEQMLGDKPSGEFQSLLESAWQECNRD